MSSTKKSEDAAPRQESMGGVTQQEWNEFFDRRIRPVLDDLIAQGTISHAHQGAGGPSAATNGDAACAGGPIAPANLGDVLCAMNASE